MILRYIRELNRYWSIGSIKGRGLWAERAEANLNNKRKGNARKRTRIGEAYPLRVVACPANTALIAQCECRVCAV